MNYKSVLSVTAVFVALFACSMIGYILGATASPEEKPPVQIAQVSNKQLSEKAGTHSADSNSDKTDEKSETAASASSARYILRESDGKVGLFIRSVDGKERLHSSYDVPIMFLPQNDRDSLKEGIEFESLDEIIKFVEDYVG